MSISKKQGSKQTEEEIGNQLPEPMLPNEKHMVVKKNPHAHKGSKNQHILSSNFFLFLIFKPETL